MASRTLQHDLRFVEMNDLLKHGDPAPNALKRMKELYHTISVKYLSPPNVHKFMEIEDYLKRRESGMDHLTAYRTSCLRSRDEKMKIYKGTKASRHQTITRLRDKVMAPVLEKMLKEQLEVARAAGIPDDVFKTITSASLKNMHFRPGFNRSIEKAFDSVSAEGKKLEDSSM